MARRRCRRICASIVLLSATACGGGGDPAGPAAPPAITSIVLSPTSAVLQGVGATTSVSATVAPSNATGALTWTSSNAAIATVSGSGSSATVTAIGAGSATITAASGSVSGNTTVTVTPIVRSITPSRTAATVIVGATTTLTATLGADPGASTALTWTSSAASVATVDASGLVTGVAPGTATITVLSVAFPSVSATVVVTVAFPVVRSVTITPSNPGVLVGANRQLAASLDVDVGTSTAVTWSSASTSVAQVSASGMVTAVAPGTAVIRATSVANPTVSGTTTVTVTSPTVRSIVVSPVSPTAIVGDAPQFTATLDADAGANTAVVWSSSNLSVATVSGTGVVTTLASGSTIIRATSVLVNSVSGQTTLTVTPPPVLNGWQQKSLNPFPSGSTADVVESWSAGSTLAFAVGTPIAGERRLFKWDGTAWLFQQLSPFDNISAIGGTNTEVFIGSSAGRIARYTVSVAANPGFTEMSVPTVGCIARLVPAGGSAIVALANTTSSCFNSRAVLIYQGASWTRLPDPTVVTQIADITASSPTDIVVAGIGGTGLQRWDGSAWTTIAAPPTAGIPQSVTRVGGDLVVITGASAAARLTGSTWTAITPPTPRPNAGGLSLLRVRACGGQAYVGSTFDGRVFRLDGTSWTEIASYGVAVPGTYTTQVNCGADNVLRIVGADGGIGRFTGSSFTWETYSPWFFKSVIVRPDLIYAVGGHGIVAKFDGTRWQVDASVSSFGYLDKLSATSDGLVLASGAGSPAGVWRKSNNSWSFDAMAATPNAIWAQSSTNALAALSTGVVMQFNGSSWQTAASPNAMTVSAMDGASASLAIAVGYSGSTSTGKASRWTGTAWSDMTLPGGVPNVINVRVLNATLAYAVASNSALLRWDGSQWIVMTGPSTTANDLPLRSVDATSASDVYVLGASGVLFHFDGTAWSRLATFTAFPDVSPAYTSIAVSAQGIGVVTGTGGTLYHGAAGANFKLTPVRRRE